MKPSTFKGEHQPRVLVVDDQVENLQLVISLLRPLGYELSCVDSGKAALVSAETNPPDLVLLDISMPEMDGFEVCRRLKQMPYLREVPIIFLTAAFLDSEDVLRGFEVGAVDYIPKPVDPRIVTARVSTHIRLRMANRALAENSQLKTKLLSIIGHDLRNPIAGLMSLVSLASKCKDDFSKEDLVEMIRRMQEAVNRVYGLLENLMGWAETVQQGITVNAKPIQLLEVIGTEVDLSRLSAAKKDIQVDFTAEEVPLVETDGNIVATIIRNLLSNAVKFTPRGGQVRVRVTAEGAFVQISVEDTGVGMDPEQVESLFDVSLRSQPGTEGEKGSGFGLLICKELVNLLTGSLSVESAKGKGTRFTIRLPGVIKAG